MGGSVAQQLHTGRWLCAWTRTRPAGRRRGSESANLLHREAPCRSLPCRSLVCHVAVADEGVAVGAVVGAVGALRIGHHNGAIPPM